MPLKVSVVVPVYNPGPYIEPLIESLLCQSMPANEFEAVFVDDGCTDATPRRLDALAAEHEHFRVIHQPNSGWPGKPRNVGIDAARGEFVQFVDQDDELGPQALDRLYERAVETSSDVVIGRVSGRGRFVPVNLYRRRVDHATLADQPLTSSLSPHKFFRRAMLLEHDIRFPEGRRRLEDHPFVMRCYFAARNIAILADYPCYYFNKRGDEANSSLRMFDPVGYFGNVEDTIDIIEANTEPGKLRNKLLARFYRSEILARLREPVVFRESDQFRRAYFDAARALGDKRFPDAVPDGMALPGQLRSKLLRAGRFDDLVEFATRCRDVEASAELTDLDWIDGRLRVRLLAWMSHGEDSFVRWLPVDGRYRFDPRLTDGLFDPHECELPSAGKVLGEVTFDLTVRHRDTGVEWWIPCTVATDLVPAPDAGDGHAVTSQVTATAEFDPATAYGGQPLSTGRWDFYVHLSFGGLLRKTRLAGAPSIRPPGPVVLGDTARSVEPYLTGDHGNLSLHVSEVHRLTHTDHQMTAPIPAHNADPVASWARRAGDQIRIAVRFRDLDVPNHGQVRLRLRRGPDTVDAASDVTRSPHGYDIRTQLPAAGLTPGVWWMSLRLPDHTEYATTDARILIPDTGPIALLTAGVPKRRSAVPGRRGGPLTRRTVHTLGKLADLALGTLPSDKAIRYRATLRRAARKLRI